MVSAAGLETQGSEVAENVAGGVGGGFCSGVVKGVVMVEVLSL